MKDSQFVNTVGKFHKRGASVYILGCAVIVSIAGLIGKIIGEYYFRESFLSSLILMTL